MYAPLRIPALLSALTGLESFIRRRRLDGMAVYMATMMAGSVVVSLISGSTRFLLAREALLTGGHGRLVHLEHVDRSPAGSPLLQAVARRPLSVALALGRAVGALPPLSPAVADFQPAVGLGTLMDSALRIVMAYTLRPDSVPALGTALYAETSLVLIVVTNAYYIASGFYDSSSRLYLRTA